MRALLLLIALLCPPAAASPAAAPRLTSIAIPGARPFQKVARDVLAVRFALSPDLAAGAGLFDDALAVPSYAPERVSALKKRLVADLRALAAMSWRSWPIDDQIDHRWVFTVGLEDLRRLSVERRFEHRPGDWLEPVTGAYLAMLSYAPDRPELRAKLTAQIPAMLGEIRALCSPTERDRVIALGLLTGLQTSVALDAEGAPRAAALAAIQAYREALEASQPAEEVRVIGPENYAWRLKNVLLLPWTPDELLAVAESELAQVDAELAALEADLEPMPELSEEERAAAATLDQAGLLRLYDGLVEDYFGRLRASGALTVPEGVGPIHARPTPDALIPLTGDGGSMNPPPTYVASNVGAWNVEHVGADWAQADREQTVHAFRYPELSGLGTYAVHEGVPGHHLQLSVARLSPDPLRSVALDNVTVEGWALYAEQLFWEAGGFGDSRRARARVLRSWRFRIRRVIYDVNVETGRWSLQQAADYKYDAEPGQGRVDEDLLRTVNWPTQLLCYFAGKMEILALREASQRAAGAAWSGREFHDALLGMGSIPLALSRAKLLGEALPDLPAEQDWTAR